MIWVHNIWYFFFQLYSFERCTLLLTGAAVHLSYENSAGISNNKHLFRCSHLANLKIVRIQNTIDRY